MHVQLEQDSALCEIVNLSIKLSTTNNLERFKIYFDVCQSNFLDLPDTYSVSIWFSVRSYIRFDLIFNSISFSESNMYHSELSTALGSGEIDVIWSSSGLVLQPEQVGHIVRVGVTLRTYFFIFTCSTLLVYSLTSQFRFWRTRWPSLFLGNQVKLVNLGLLICGRSVEIWRFVKNYKSNVRENLDRASGLPLPF